MASLRAWAAAQGLSLRQAQELALEAGIFPEALERNFPSLTPAEQLTLGRGSAQAGDHLGHRGARRDFQ
jgi:hypothetical protein